MFDIADGKKLNQANLCKLNYYREDVKYRKFRKTDGVHFSKMTSILFYPIL